jgi:mono/diheme cytochrome c family protein
MNSSKPGGNMCKKLGITLLLASFINTVNADSQTMRDSVRGELLYTTHCITCHNSKIHWRDKKIARDWNSLKNEVRRWEMTSTLNWDDDDITVVARYLNDIHYHYIIRY